MENSRVEQSNFQMKGFIDIHKAVSTDIPERLQSKDALCI